MVVAHGVGGQMTSSALSCALCGAPLGAVSFIVIRHGRAERRCQPCRRGRLVYRPFEIPDYSGSCRPLRPRFLADMVLK